MLRSKSSSKIHIPEKLCHKSLPIINLFPSLLSYVYPL